MTNNPFDAVPTDEFVLITEVFDDALIRQAAVQNAEATPDKSTEDIMRTIRSVCIRRADGDEPDVPLVDMTDKSAITEIDQYVIESVIDKAKAANEFEDPIPIFRSKDMVFAFYPRDREACLNQIMDISVERENYEQAAVVRDLLDDT